MSVNKNAQLKFQNAPAAAPVQAVIELESLLEVPSGGTTGQVLVKTADGYAWTAMPIELPEGGTEGQILVKTAEGGLAWADAPVELPAGGTEGQILAVNAEGNLVWVDAPVELPDYSLLANGDYKLHMVDGVPSWVAIV